MKVKLSTHEKAPFEGGRFAEQTIDSVASDGLWRDDAPELKPCWSNPSSGNNVRYGFHI